MNLLYYLAFVGLFYTVFFIAVQIFKKLLGSSAQKRIADLEANYKASVQEIRDMGEDPDNSFNAEKFIAESEEFKKTEALIKQRKESMLRKQKGCFYISCVTIPLGLVLIVVAIVNAMTIPTGYFLPYLYASVPFIPAFTITDALEYIKRKKKQ